MKNYIRKPLFEPLWKALQSDVNLIQAVVGPRQVGKTTLALQILEKWPGPKIYETADQPDVPTAEWISRQWQKARDLCHSSKDNVLLILDEIQKIPRWSEAAKRLFDEDKRTKGLHIRVMLLGSSSLLMQRGLAESLAGRFELHRHSQWSYAECRDYFGLSFEEYVYFGGYPGALPLRSDEPRWARYIRDSLIETVLAKDVFLMSPVAKPALLRQAFGLAVAHPAEILSYQKMLGTLQDAGNTTTIASYLNLLSNAFLVTSLERYSGSRVKKRGSIPKILVLDNALVSAMTGRTFQEVRQDSVLFGRLIENVVGARLYMFIEGLGGRLYYWRQRNDEVDYVVCLGKRIIALEVKSGAPRRKPAAFPSFSRKYKMAKSLVISDSEAGNIDSIANIKLEDFLQDPQIILE